MVRCAPTLWNRSILDELGCPALISSLGYRGAGPTAREHGHRWWRFLSRTIGVHHNHGNLWDHPHGNLDYLRRRGFNRVEHPQPRMPAHRCDSLALRYGAMWRTITTGAWTANRRRVLDDSPGSDHLGTAVETQPDSTRVVTGHGSNQCSGFALAMPPSGWQHGPVLNLPPIPKEAAS